MAYHITSSSASSQPSFLSFSSSSSSPSLSTLFPSDFDSNDFDLSSFALHQYMLALLTSPLTVVETLSEVQLQKRTDQESDPDIETLRTEGAIQQIDPMQGGVWDNVRLIVRSENEGLSSLLKGSFTTFLYNASYTFLQPALEEVFNDYLDVYDDNNPATLALSHVVVGGLLSPLELIRTRLIVQSTTPRRSYFGPVDAVWTIKEEGGSIGSLYAARLVLPSILIRTASPLLRLVSAHLITEELHLDPGFNPLLYRLAVLGFMAIEVALLTPIEIARKRLQVQRLSYASQSVRSLAEGEVPQAFDTCVEVASAPYAGILSAIWSIVNEEGGKQRRRPKKNARRGIVDDGNDDDDELEKILSTKKRGGNSSIQKLWLGLKTLYRGYWARYAANVVVYIFEDIGRGDEW
ncbi:mitochondrial carrier domain-containing protein [Polychytrium aggregatum]|uniref:mitochondrial carrier domain-containing protein n=1 Tax=Polychytrium aggregatum TaxID=110093 RepID=UPI0022FDF632|nr:mitochondrial carrier domain-containing protein [Polychytrium aggregatum]KAI9205678.1 mitochondrial carrier domain-containing protein [Polychytrium aggregatum]